MEFVKAGAFHGFCGELLGFAGFVGGEIARVGTQHAAIQLYDARHGIVQEGAVMRNHHQRPAVFIFPRENFFEDENGLNIEMIRGFVQKQQIRFQTQGERQGRALFFAARGFGGIGVRVEFQALQVFFEPRNRRPFFPVVANGVKRPARNEAVAEGGGLRQLRLLFDVDGAHAVLQNEFAVVQFVPAGNDFQEGTFSRAVSADEAHAFAGFKAHGGMIQERGFPPGEFGVG